ncbi:TonB-linked outer membrane protein, SusC/RagA family [Pricia antarctica]|uniref:TonB-linked outer membrane protein, SusC/RagA family n=1 Tax=Pricia antarctica TaxID=641691 RepID=A0A1G7G7M3_9FLAO|nr:TonB-dependent receptor [Pricia antarctica]SDE84065.1 TonB-linked outer membrane protein, SusC/RagA family [Pricia antarctica]
MNKKVNSLLSLFLGRTNNIFLIGMRVSTLLLCIGLTSVYAHTSNAQNIDIDLKDVPITTFFKEVQEKSDYVIIYRDEVIADTKRVTVRASSATLEKILTDVLGPLGLGYEIINRQIIINKKGPSIDDNGANIIKTPFQQSVNGTVTDTDGVPLPGANIVEKGTSNGVTADFDGNFSLNIADENAILVVSYIGFSTKEVDVNGQSTVNVSLEESAQGLDEVVVVGYGTQKRKDITGSVASVSSEDIADIPMTNINDGLVGRIPGLDIVSSGGGPGSTNQLQLRGQRSFTASNDPLIILDGSPYYGSLNDISPYDIESVDVLKDASSTAIYGARGANGVIIITTKRGVTGAPRFTLESYTGPMIAYGTIPYADAQQYAEIGREAYRAIDGYPEGGTNAEADEIIFDEIEIQAIKKGGKGLNYQDLLYRSGTQKKHQLTVTGGSENVKYNVSGSYFNNEGIIPGESFARYSLRTNLDFTFSPIFTAGTSILLNNTLNQRKSSGALFQAFQSSPLGKLYEDDGSPRFTATADGLVLNPFADYLYDSYRWDNKSWGAVLNVFGEAKILPELTYRINLGTNFKLRTIKESAGFFSLERNLGTPTAEVANSVDNLLLYESILTYNKTFNEKHQLTVTAIQGSQSTRIETTGAGVSDLPYEESRYHNLGSATLVNSVSSDLVETNLLSYAGRLFYGYDSKYLLTLSMRADGASQFSPDHKWGYFPSAAFAYRLSGENFMKSTENWLNDLKIRLSYGATGNQGIGPYQTQGGVARSAYSWNEAPGFGYYPNELQNRDLKWETTSVYNLGLDFRLFKGRLSGSMDIYKTDTYDLLMFRKLPIISGYDQVLQNVGKTKNNGFELALSSVNVIGANFNWKTDFTFFRNRTEIAELYNGKVDDIGNRWFIGEPIEVFYDYKKIGIWQENERAEAASYGEEPGQIKVLDVDNDGAITDEDRMVLGSPQPDFVSNLTNSFKYKNFDLSIQTFIRWGGMASIGAFEPFSKKRYNKLVFDYWTPSNPTNNYPRPNQLYEDGGLYGTTLTYRDASLISLRQVSLGYRFPASVLDRLPLTNLRLYLSGENLAYWTKSELREFNMKGDLAGTVPDGGGTREISPYPATRTVILGINLQF